MRHCGIPGCEQPHRARGWCKDHYSAWYQNGDPLLWRRQPNLGVCSAPGCSKRPRSRTAAYCEMHYGRMRRNGSLDGPNREASPGIVHEQGYILVYAPNHPIASRRHPHVYEHRLVFYDTFGLGPHRCRWCDVELTWCEVHVDHLDDTKRNNDPTNLVAACFTCNTQRGDPGRAKSIAAHSPLITFDGVTLPLSQWAHRLGIKSASLRLRLRNGWPLERALTEPRGRFGPRRGRGFRFLSVAACNRLAAHA